MTRFHRVVSCTAVFMVLVASTSCKKEEQSSQESTTLQNSSVKSIVQVDFSGLISQLVKQNDVTKRAVVLKGNSHHPHEFVIRLPEMKATETDLQFIGKDVECDKDKKAGCEITTIEEGITLSIAAMEPSLTPTLTFDTLVPSLGEANGSAIPASKLHGDLKKATPTTGGPFLAYFDFTGGELSAVGFCGHGAFKKAKTQDEVQRRFAETVTLLGTTPSAAKLTVTNNKGKSVTFEFTHPDYVHIRIRNMPTSSSGSDHFPLYNQLFDLSAGISLPEVNTDKACKGKGTVVGCSDSQWP